MLKPDGPQMSEETSSDAMTTASPPQPPQPASPATPPATTPITPEPVLPPSPPSPPTTPPTAEPQKPKQKYIKVPENLYVVLRNVLETRVNGTWQELFPIIGAFQQCAPNVVEE